MPRSTLVWRAVSVSSAECVGESRCAFGDECFSAQARARAMEADIVVTNHALLAIDAIEGVPVLPDRSALVVDEAHELVDRITSAVTGELSVSALERLVGEAARVSDDEARWLMRSTIWRSLLMSSRKRIRHLGSNHRVDADLVLGPRADSGLHAGIGVGAVCGSVRRLSATPAAPTRGTDAAALQRVRAGAEDVFARRATHRALEF